ncbi:MAG: hypothetical protein F6K19_01665 [Cyanothece sp. SIO1E1]|nr:hypothetical protein [Cyanothece sp. SIO1E1]
MEVLMATSREFIANQSKLSDKGVYYATDLKKCKIADGIKKYILTPDVYYFTVEITKAQLAAGNVTPIELFPALGAGIAVEVVDYFEQFKYSDAVYATNTTLNIKHSGGSVNFVAATISGGSDANRTVTPTKGALLANAALIAEVASGNPTGGPTADTFVSYTLTIGVRAHKIA